jgi:hypothetical protein
VNGETSSVRQGRTPSPEREGKRCFANRFGEWEVGRREDVRQLLKPERLFMKQMFDSTTKMGTAGGTLLTIFANISTEDISKTIVLAGVGAIVSFGVTLLLKVILKKFRR